MWKASELAADSEATPPPAPVIHERDMEIGVGRTASTPVGNRSSTTPEKHKSWRNSLSSRPKSKSVDDFTPEKVLPAVRSDRPLKPSRNPPKTSIYDFFPILRLFKPIVDLIFEGKLSHINEGGQRTVIGRKKDVMVESNVPLEISLFLSSYFAWLLQSTLVAPVCQHLITVMHQRIGTECVLSGRGNVYQQQSYILARTSHESRESQEHTPSFRIPSTSPYDSLVSLASSNIF